LLKRENLRICYISGILLKRMKDAGQYSITRRSYFFPRTTEGTGIGPDPGEIVGEIGEIGDFWGFGELGGFGKEMVPQVMALVAKGGKTAPFSFGANFALGSFIYFGSADQKDPVAKACQSVALQSGSHQRCLFGIAGCFWQSFDAFVRLDSHSYRGEKNV